MITQWLHRTNLGRVVYDRPVHFFKRRDALRIAQSAGVDAIYVSTMSWERIVALLEGFESVESGIAVDLGGGTFGGGGATRGFEKPGRTPTPRMIVIIERMV